MASEIEDIEIERSLRARRRVGLADLLAASGVTGDLPLRCTGSTAVATSWVLPEPRIYASTAGRQTSAV